MKAHEIPKASTRSESTVVSAIMKYTCCFADTLFYGQVSLMNAQPRAGK